MIEIEGHNLDPVSLAEVQRDIDTAVRLGCAAGVSAPYLKLHLAALDRTPATVTVAHAVPAPAGSRPVSFAQRCEWERQRQTFQLVSQGQTIWVVGGSMIGVQYGIGEVLRCVLGVIWAGVDEETDTIFAPPRPLPLSVQSPVIPLRSRDGVGPTAGERETPEMVQRYVRWMARNRFNLWRRPSRSLVRESHAYQRACLDTCASRGVLFTLGDHSMDYFLPGEEFERRPEWFGLRDGRRTRTAHVHMPDCPHLDAELPIQPCYSNPEVQEYITDRIAEHLRDYPEASIFGLWPHDGVNNWCECEACLRRTPYEHMYHLAMQLLPKIPADMPVELIAYSNLLNLPWAPLPHSDRTFTMFCPYLRHYRHRIFDPYDGPFETGRLYPRPDRINPLDEREYGPLFEAWAEACRQSGSAIAVFEYGGNFYDETRRTDRTRYLYQPPPALIGDEIEWYRQRGVQVYYICTAFRGWPDTFTDTSLAQMLWHGKAALDAFADDYYRAMLGPAGPSVRHALSAVADTLHGSRIPEEALSVLDKALTAVGDSRRTRRYTLWSRYIRLAKAVREAEARNDGDAMLAGEALVGDFWDAHADELGACLNVPAFQRYGRINSQRVRDTVAGVAGREYVL